MYLFADIADGSYLLATSNGDYRLACLSNDDSSERCAPIVLARDEYRANRDLLLTPNAVIRGRLVDENGAAISDATIRMSSSSEQLLPSGSMARLMLGRGVTTRGDGAFEVRGVAPGAWQIEASLPPSKPSIGIPFFYPGVVDRASATLIEVVAGQVLDNLVFTVPATESNVLTVHVAPGPLPIEDIRATLLRTSPTIARTIALDADGVGSIKGAPPGRYFIGARGWINDAAWAAFDVIDLQSPAMDVSLPSSPTGRGSFPR